MSKGKVARAPVRYEHKRLWVAAHLFDEQMAVLGADRWALVAVVQDKARKLREGPSGEAWYPGDVCYLRREVT